MTIGMFFGYMPLHFNIASGAMYSANIAPLDFAWVTFQIMLFHHSIFVIIVCNPFMTAFVANDTTIALVFIRVNPLSDICLYG